MDCRAYVTTLLEGRAPGAHLESRDATPVGDRRRGLLTRLLDLVDHWVSERVDAEARARGFTVTRLPGTRIHVYRNDTLRDRRYEHEECAGAGWVGAGECVRCEGTRVVTRSTRRFRQVS